MRRGSKLLHDKPYLPYIAPSFIVVGLLAIFPTIFLYLVSATNYELGTNLATTKIIFFDNFIRIFSGRDRDFWASVFRTFRFTAIVTAIEILLGFGLAYLFNREFKGKAIAFAILIIPITMTPTITAQIWKLMMNADSGIINYFLKTIAGTSVTWLGPDLSMLSIMIVDIWQWVPYVGLILYAGLRALPVDPYESATIDGASNWQLLTHLTLPLLRRTIALAILFRVIDCFRLFDIPFVLTQGGNKTLMMSLHIYRLASAQTGWVARAAAVAIVLQLIVSLIARLFAREFGRGSVL